MQACDGWEAVFFSYDDGELFCETVICWALVSERPYVENGKDEERYIEGQVLDLNLSSLTQSASSMMAVFSFRGGCSMTPLRRLLKGILHHLHCYPLFHGLEPFKNCLKIEFLV
jgi:hypothetical protein